MGPLATSPAESLIALAAKDEALRQPARFAAALAVITNIPLNRRLAVLVRAADSRPHENVRALRRRA